MPKPHLITVNPFDLAHGLPQGWVERARFIQNHHHLINPRFYSESARRRLDALLVQASGQWKAKSQAVQSHNQAASL